MIDSGHRLICEKKQRNVRIIPQDLIESRLFAAATGLDSQSLKEEAAAPTATSSRATPAATSEELLTGLCELTQQSSREALEERRPTSPAGGSVSVPTNYFGVTEETYLVIKEL